MTNLNGVGAPSGSAGRWSLAGFSGISGGTEPLNVDSVSPIYRLAPVDLDTIRHGLEGRVEASLSAYAANVRLRERQSAELAAAQQAKRMDSDLDSELARLKSEFDSNSFQKRVDASLDRLRLQMLIIVLQNQPDEMHVPGGKRDTELAAAKAKLASLDGDVALGITQLERHYHASIAEAKKKWQDQAGDIKRRELELAEHRAQEAIKIRKGSALVSTSLFISEISPNTRRNPAQPARSRASLNFASDVVLAKEVNNKIDLSAKSAVVPARELIVKLLTETAPLGASADQLNSRIRRITSVLP